MSAPSGAAARTGVLARIGAFVAGAVPPPPARAVAAAAVLDTVGVALAGTAEPAARAVQRTLAASAHGEAGVWGTARRASATDAALANGTAAHALDFDDMCFVSLAHPSAPLVPAAVAAAEARGASGAALLDAYVVGFEVEARLGRAMNPRHYQRGWHCTSTLGTIGAAAAAARLFGLDPAVAAHALAIAASEACGLKANFGTMVKPLHAGIAARNGIEAARLAGAGLTAAAGAIEGPQGLLHAMDSERASLDEFVADLGDRWEIVDTGIAVKLYPSCAATHPTLDAVLDARRGGGFGAEEIEAVEVGVDAVTPTVLLYDRPASGLEAKFSMPFCVAAAILDGAVGVDTFNAARLADPRLTALMSRVSMEVDGSLDPQAPALTEARVTLRLRDGRAIVCEAHGARGYPDRPASVEEMERKFQGCARRVLPGGAADQALEALRGLEVMKDIRTLTASLAARPST